MSCTSCYYFVHKLIFIIKIFIHICIFLDAKDFENNIEPEVEHGPKLGINKNIL